ncbi:hypothetical protein E2C01_059651 [Portunus trituberculatus]|uniref:Uncharacterized protein n=1 Tax=Portunus trituberculatus TaxID=210409 RepID=A0A5B7H6G2_PORTR|nr:hypothetical protein [Portunus trituberculatus]
MMTGWISNLRRDTKGKQLLSNGAMMNAKAQNELN